jgi:hypothetical protein
MAKSKNSRVVGGWAFLIALIIAVILGLIGGLSGIWLLILVAIGIIAGFLNITEAESMPFLISGAVIIIASALGQGAYGDNNDIIGLTIRNILSALLVMFVPTTIIVAIKNVFVLARD